MLTHLFLCVWNARHPDDILEDIFRRLDSADKVQRGHALAILVEVFKTNAKLAQGSGQRCTELSKRLADQLLKRLYDAQQPAFVLALAPNILVVRVPRHDTELTLRLEASALFANLGTCNRVTLDRVVKAVHAIRVRCLSTNLDHQSRGTLCQPSCA
jgi:hypothetical protein